MDAYCAEICKLEGHFEGIEFQHVPRNNNIAADVLSKLGSRQALVPAGVFVQDLCKPSIKLLDSNNPEPPSNDQNLAPPRDVLMTEKEDDWRKPFIDLLDQLVPDDKAEQERIMRRSANYVVIGSDLYRKAASTVLTDKRRIPLRFASVQAPHLFHHGIPKVLVNLRSKGITSVRSTFTL
jgi:hypothetical protein